MAERCLEIEELGEMLRSEPGDPRWHHAQACPRCASSLAAYQEFLRLRAEAGDAREEDAATRLDAFVEETVLGGASQPAATPTPGPLRRWLASLTSPRRLAPVFGGALAVAILAVWVVRPWVGGHDGPMRLRGEETTPAIRTYAALPLQDGRLELRWAAVPGAQSYVVVFLLPSFRELGRCEVGPDTFAVIGPETLPEPHALPFRGFWQVRALDELAEVAGSRPAPLILPAP